MANIIIRPFDIYSIANDFISITNITTLFDRKQIIKSIKTNLLLYSLPHAEACNELTGPFPRHFARATQLLLKKCRSGGEPLATLCPI